MSWDFGSLAPGDKPFRLELVFDGEPIKDVDGKAAYIDVHSMDSSIARRFDKKERVTAIENIRKGKGPSEIIDPLERNLAKLAALTAEWYLVDPDTGIPIDVPCSAESAVALYNRPNTSWITDPLFAAASNNANFTKRSASSSIATQSGTSETAAS
jgi:hypothetical protein